jgi:hypothetical protein
VRLSFHPMISTADLDRILAALESLASGAGSVRSISPFVDTSGLWGDWL